MRFVTRKLMSSWRKTRARIEAVCIRPASSGWELIFRALRINLKGNRRSLFFCARLMKFCRQTGTTKLLSASRLIGPGVDLSEATAVILLALMCGPPVVGCNANIATAAPDRRRDNGNDGLCLQI